jgi:hypothetical protein
MIRMYERLKRIENPTTDSLQQEILEATSSSGSSNSIIYSDDPLEEKIPEALNVKKIVKYDLDGHTYSAPIFARVDDLQTWNKTLDHHEKRAADILDKLEILGKATIIKTKIKGVRDRIENWISSETRDVIKIDTLKRTIRVTVMKQTIDGHG